MAGDWIKYLKGLPKKPEVFGMAKKLGCDRHEIACRLMEVWSWVDDNIADSNIDENGHAFVTLSASDLELIDAISGVAGFADAMSAVGWLQPRNGSLVFPNFGRHNGETAKQRALTTRRQQKRRAKVGGETCHAGSVTREEKRREEVTKPRNPPFRQEARNNKPSGSGSVRVLDSVEEREGLARRALSKIKTEHLRDIGLLLKLHKTLAGLDVWDLKDTPLYELKLVATAFRAKRPGVTNPGAMFSTLVQGGCKVLDMSDEDAARERLAKFLASQPSGP